LLFYVIHRWFPTTPDINTVLTFIAPYVMYIVAEQLHFSGVLAVVSGGLFLSSRSHVIFDHRSRLRGESVWSTIGFALNGLIFMLIGLELPVIVHQLGGIGLYDAIKYGLLVSAALIVIRLVSTLGASVFTRVISHVITTADSRPGWRGPLIFGWAGMRGVVSLAAALSIPLHLSNGAPFPQRNMILFISFTVILVTLVFQGLTLPLVIRWVNMEDPDHATPLEEQETMVRKKLAMAALDILKEKYANQVSANELLQSLQLKLENEARVSGRLLHPSPDEEPAGVAIDGFRDIYAEVVRGQRHKLRELNKKEGLDETVIRKFRGLLDLEEERARIQFGGAGD
ncbi:MAG TPA: cation:proton antiporter, partial [Chitinophagaceae bacterium]|nr:cation:proton antiporter [Chitinophagaceae bacterium]